MKTAMQEWVEWIKAYEYELPLELQVKANELLEMEKEQIRNAFKKGRYAIEVRDEETRVLLEKHTDEYYNETYNQNEG